MVERTNHIVFDRRSERSIHSMTRMTKVWCDRAIVRVWLIPIALFSIVAIGSWQFDRLNQPPDVSQLPISRTDELVEEPIRPIPLQLALDPRKVESAEWVPQQARPF